MAVSVDGLQQGIMTSIAEGSAPVFDPVADGHDGGLTKPGFGRIF